MSGPDERLSAAVRRTIDSLNERNETGRWLPRNEEQAWHYFAGTLTAWLGKDIADEMVAAVVGLVALPEDQRSTDAPSEAWVNQGRNDRPAPFQAVGLLSYDPEEDTLS